MWTPGRVDLCRIFPRTTYSEGIVGALYPVVVVDKYMITVVLYDKVLPLPACFGFLVFHFYLALSILKNSRTISEGSLSCSSS